MNIIECQQGTDEWFTARLGKITGTGFSKVMAKDKRNKSLRGKTSKDYMMQLLAERLSGCRKDTFVNGAMLWGIDNEDTARARYEAVNGVSVQQIGFAGLSENVGVSPDGWVNKDGTIEIKCPDTTTHITTILTNKAPAAYKPQMQGGLWIADRQWCDFISFDPRVKDCPQIWVIRVERDQEYIDNLKREVIGFILELEELTEKIKSYSPF